MVKKFDWRQAIGFGWDTMKTNIVFFITLLVIAFIVTLIPEIPRVLLEKSVPPISFVFSIISMIVQMIVGMGIIKIAIKLHDQQKPELSDLMPDWPLFLNYFLTTLAFAVIVFVALIPAILAFMFAGYIFSKAAILGVIAVIAGIGLLAIPVIISLGLQFATYLVVDKNNGPIEALKQSWAITNQSKLYLFLFALLLAGINILGVLCLLIGLLVTFPVTIMALVFVYRKLLGAESAKPA